LFAAHPIHAEAVAMVYGQLELLAALFSQLTIGLYVMAWNRRESPRPALFAEALGFSFLAICSKESAIMLPALLLLVRGLFLTKAEAPGAARGRFFRGLVWDALFCLPILGYLAL